MKLSKIQQNHVFVCLVIVLGFYHGKLPWRKRHLGEYVWNFPSIEDANLRKAKDRICSWLNERTLQGTHNTSHQQGIWENHRLKNMDMGGDMWSFVEGDMSLLLGASLPYEGTWTSIKGWEGWASSIFLGGGNWNMFKFHPNLGKWSNLTCAYFSDGLVKNHHLVQSYTKNLWKRSHMDPNRESKHPSTDHFRWGERYHDLLSLFEFLDNGAAGLWKTRKLRICFKSWRVGEPLGMFRCMSTTEDTHGTQKNGGLVQMMFRISIGWFFGSKCEFSRVYVVVFLGGRGWNITTTSTTTTPVLPPSYVLFQEYFAMKRWDPNQLQQKK